MAQINLPYLSSPGTLDTALPRIREAAKPDRFTGDFVSTVLQIRGGAGRAVPPFLKKIGFLKSDGSPTDLYERFRNQASSGAAMAEAIRLGYKPLYRVNEYAHKLSDADLRGAIVQVTGLEPKNNTVNLIHRTYKKLAAVASFDGKAAPRKEAPHGGGASGVKEEPPRPGHLRDGGIQLAYTINLNLPATTNIEVFNAIFRSLRENLLGDGE